MSKYSMLGVSALALVISGQGFASGSGFSERDISHNTYENYGKMKAVQTTMGGAADQSLGLLVNANHLSYRSEYRGSHNTYRNYGTMEAVQTTMGGAAIQTVGLEVNR